MTRPKTWIGGVATLPEARGRGCMSAMLRASSAWQREAGVPLGLLLGARIRYRRYGFELAGTKAILDVDANLLKNAPAVQLRRLERKDAVRVAALMHKAGSSVYRTRPWQELLLQRTELEAWGNRHGPLAAYFVCQGAKPEIIEEAIGGDLLLRGILRQHGETRRLTSIKVHRDEGSRWIVHLQRDGALEVKPAGRGMADLSLAGHKAIRLCFCI